MPKRQRPRRSASRPRGDEFDDYVVHPRYGQRPRITGLQPEKSATTKPGEPYVKLHWHSPEPVRIPNTAIAADISRQHFTTMPVTHYFDVKRVCQGCRQPFLFFAAEQKHWYEELGFSIEADCVRCVPCRKQQQGIARQRESYERLFHVEHRTPEENLEMAECCLALIEASVFDRRQTERVRMLLRGAPEKPRDGLMQRVLVLERDRET
jgi:hypothetical protein